MEQYRLIGFLNIFDIIPDFLYPIFQNKDKYYFQDGCNDKIKNFVPVKSSVYSMIRKSNEFKEIIGESNVILTTKSDPIYAFQIESEKIVCGESKYILEFFKTYSTNDKNLKEEIEDLKKELNNAVDIGKCEKYKVLSNQKDYYKNKGNKFWGT